MRVIHRIRAVLCRVMGHVWIVDGDNQRFCRSCGREQYLFVRLKIGPVWRDLD